MDEEFYDTLSKAGLARKEKALKTILNKEREMRVKQRKKQRRQEED